MKLKRILKELEAEDFGRLDIEQPGDAYHLALENLYGAVLKMNEGIGLEEQYNYDRRNNVDDMLLFGLAEIKEIRRDAQSILNRLSGMLSKRRNAIDRAMKKDTMSID